jgi:hypothetical protein
MGRVRRTRAYLITNAASLLGVAPTTAADRLRDAPKRMTVDEARIRIAAPATPAASNDARIQRRKLLALGAAGTAAAAPLAFPKFAAAAGAQPAFVDASNTFVRTQTIDPQDAGPAALQINQRNIDTALAISSHGVGLSVAHDVDWAGEVHDLVDLTTTSQGDAIFITHRGGVPPGATAGQGGSAGLNILVPYHLDSDASGFSGTVVNDRTNIPAIFVQTMPSNDEVNAMAVSHWGDGYAMSLLVQPPVGRGAAFPVGTGGGISMGDWSSKSSLTITKGTAPAYGHAIVNLYGKGSYLGLAIRDESGFPKVRLRPDGTAAFGMGQAEPWGRLCVQSDSPGVPNTFVLINNDSTVGNGARILFSDNNAFSAGYARIDATFESKGNAQDGALKLIVAAGGKMRERIKLNPTGIGFFGQAPAAQPSLTYSRRTENAAQTQLRQALAALGLVADNTTS